MAAKKEITPEQLAKARHLYEQTLAPVDDIAAMLGLSRGRFYHRVRTLGWRRRRVGKADFEFARALTEAAAEHGQAQPPSDPPAPLDLDRRAEMRLAIASRIQAIVERQLDAIERVLAAVTPADQGEADRSARTLANLARASREIAALNEPEDATKPNDADNDRDIVPVDLDELRDELARRLRGLADARRAGRA